LVEGVGIVRRFFCFGEQASALFGYGNPAVRSIFFAMLVVRPRRFLKPTRFLLGQQKLFHFHQVYFTLVSVSFASQSA